MPYLAIERVLLSINSYLLLWYLLRSSFGTSLLRIPVKLLSMGIYPGDLLWIHNDADEFTPSKQKLCDYSNSLPPDSIPSVTGMELPVTLGTMKNIFFLFVVAMLFFSVSFFLWNIPHSKEAKKTWKFNIYISKILIPILFEINYEWVPKHHYYSLHLVCLVQQFSTCGQ